MKYNILPFFCLLFVALTLCYTPANGIPHPRLKNSVRREEEDGWEKDVEVILGDGKDHDDQKSDKEDEKGEKSDKDDKIDNDEDKDENPEDIWKEIAEQAECGNCDKKSAPTFPGATNCGGCEYCATCDTVYFSCYEEKCLPCGVDGECATKCHVEQCVPRRNKCLLVLCPGFGAKTLISVAPFMEEEIAGEIEPSASPEMDDEPVDMFDAVASKI